MSKAPYSSSSLKQNALHFLFGKAISALLNIVILLWLVRLLALEEYGVYVTLGAGMDLALAMTSFGLPWVSGRYLPEFRLYASGMQLQRFIWQIIIFILMFAVISALLALDFLPQLLSPLKILAYLKSAELYLLVFILESLRQNIQDCILAPLMQQAHAQLSQVARNLGLLAALCVFVFEGQVHIQEVILAELVGTIVGSLLAFLGLIRYLKEHRKLEGKAEWQPPAWREIMHTAGNMYFSYLVTLSYSQQVFIFLIQRFLGVEATALFGFLLNLYNQICRYLPATLLFGLIRPKLIASFVGEGGMTQLTQNANFVGKLSLFVLMPLLIFIWLSGGELLTLLSDGKFSHSGFYLSAMVLTLIPFSQRQILETVAVACGKSHFCSWGSMMGISTLFLAIWLLERGYGLWSPILAMILSQSIFNLTLSFAMGLSTRYRPDLVGQIKLATAAICSFILSLLLGLLWTTRDQSNAETFTQILQKFHLSLLQSLSSQNIIAINGWIEVAIAGTLALIFFLMSAFILKPFRSNERAKINQLLQRKLFVW